MLFIINIIRMKQNILRTGGDNITNKETDASYVIEVENLTKEFNGFRAVENISFKVKKGDIFGFLGPNGAGKTTTIRMLTTIIRPSKGTAKVLGQDIQHRALDIKKRIGFMPDVPGFYGEMKATELLNFYADFYRMPKSKREKKVENLLNMMQLDEFKNKKVKTFSRGMKQKLGFASSLLNDPELLILDEPTIGLDPTTIHFFKKSIKSLNGEGVTIFLSSHILSDVQALSNKVGIIDHGKIIAVDTIESLSKKISSSANKIIIISYENISEKALNAVKNLDGVLKLNKNESIKKIEIEIDSKKSIIPLINKTLVTHNVSITSIETKEMNLEEIFLSLVGEK